MNHLEAKFKQIIAPVSAQWARQRRQEAYAALDPEWAAEIFDQLSLNDTALESGLANDEYEAVVRNLKHQLGSQGIRYEELLTSQADADMQPFFGQLAARFDDSFLRLNDALWRSGTLVKIPKGVSCAMPLQAIRNPWTATLDRQLVVVEPGAHLEYISGCVSEATPAHTPLTIPIIEIFVQENASLTYIELENLTQPQDHRGLTVFYLEKGAHLNICSAHLGASRFSRVPVVMGNKEARVSGHLIEVAGNENKSGCGFTIQGPAEADLRFFAIEKGARVEFQTQPEPTQKMVYSLGGPHETMDSEALEAMLAAFPLEYAAEIQAALT